MKLRPLPFFLMVLAGIGLAKAQEGNELKDSKAFDPEGGTNKRVHIVPVEGTIDLGLGPFVERVIDSADDNDVVVLDIKTFGGRVDAAVMIRDALLSSKVPTVAYIDRRAISAGALISLATDTIIMSPGASIGAATPVQQGQGGEMKATSEKVVSYMRAEMRATAEAKGRRAELAEAMVDPDVEVKDVVPKGKLLTLTSDEALKLGMADAIASTLEDGLELLNLQDAKRVQAETFWAERVARFLTDPVVSSMLMTFGFLGLLMELYTPGFGVGGIIGLTCLSLFFLGQYAARLAGAEEVVLLALGMGLLALEIFVIPGFGVAGIAGIACVLIALAMSIVELELPWDVSFELGYLQDALVAMVIRIAILIVLLTIATYLMAKYLPESRFASWLVFRARPADGPGSKAPLGAEAPGGSLPKDYRHLRGKQGKSKTVLRPTGVAVIDGERVDVIAEGQWIDPETPVEVVEVDGYRIVVRTIEASAGEEDEP